MNTRMLALSVVVAAMLGGVFGCREKGGGNSEPVLYYGIAQEVEHLYTPGGTKVAYPLWLWPEARALADAEIDAANVPPGWTVEVTVPVIPHPNNPRVIVRGLTFWELQLIQVGKQFNAAEGPFLPALAHEVDHAWHPEDRCRGHAPGAADCP